MVPRAVRLAALALVSLSTAALAQERGLSEPSHQAGEYLVQRSGASWLYQMPKGARARWTINAFIDWKASYSFSIGKRVGAGAWRVKEGAWLERTLARGEGEMVVLPAVVKEGSRWTAPASIERGTGGTTQYEVMALNAVVDLPGNHRIENCLAVLETDLDGSKPWTHYYALNLGKVAVRGTEDWVLQLVQFSPGKGRAE